MEKINKITEIPEWPVRKAPQGRFDTTVQVCMDKIKTMVDDLNSDFIPKANKLQNIVNNTNIQDKIFYVGGDNASDTLDVGSGRGESPELPFETIKATCNYIATNFITKNTITIYVQQNINLDSIDLYPNNTIIITSDTSTKKTITFTQNTNFMAGSLVFKNLSIVCNSYIIQAYGQYHPINLQFDNVTFNGNDYSIVTNQMAQTIFNGNIVFNGSSQSSGLIRCDNGGRTIFMTNKVSGNITGKRYSATYGSLILVRGQGLNFIPGTINGDCDSSSKYA